MAQASKNLRTLAEEWEIATVGMVDGKLTMDEWTNRLNTANSGHDWAGMGTAVKQYTESDFPLTASESDMMKKRDLKNLEDKKVTREEAIRAIQTTFSPSFR